MVSNTQGKLHINHRVQADSAYNSILFMRPHGIKVSFFSVYRTDLVYCRGNGKCITVCSFLLTLGQGSLGLSCSSFVTIRNSNHRACFLSIYFTLISFFLPLFSRHFSFLSCSEKFFYGFLWIFMDFCSIS